MKYNTIVSMFVFLFLTACNPDFNINQKEKTSKETSTLTGSEENKIPISRSRESIADLSGSNIVVKATTKESSVDNKEKGDALTSIGSSINIPIEESSKSTESIDNTEIVESLESIKSQETSSIKSIQDQEKTEQELAKTEEEQRKKIEEEQRKKIEEEQRKKIEEEQRKKIEEEQRKKIEEEQRKKIEEAKRQQEEEEKQQQEEERQREEEEEKQAKDTIEILTKKIDEITRDIDAIKHKSSFVEDVKREIVATTEVRDKITGPIYDYFTDGSNAIYAVWYDLDTDLEELLKKLRNTRSDLRVKLNVGNQRYTGGRNEPKLKENVKVVEIKSDLDKLKSELKGVKEYLNNQSNFEKIKENIVNSYNE